MAGTLKHDYFIYYKSSNYTERYYNTPEQTMCFTTRYKADKKANRV